jgi:hypothetical protein
MTAFSAVFYRWEIMCPEDTANLVPEFGYQTILPFSDYPYLTGGIVAGIFRCGINHAGSTKERGEAGAASTTVLRDPGIPDVVSCRKWTFIISYRRADSLLFRYRGASFNLCRRALDLVPGCHNSRNIS